ncbi:MAG: hypothetical protein IJR96_01750 [Pseudobutyrivibrio sp.]|nr:hypothetical protein [Pseudobutyrivibrio sp.]
MGWNFEDESKPYGPDEQYEDLEAIRAMLHDAQRRINRGKLEKSEIDLSINIDVEKNDNQ